VRFKGVIERLPVDVLRMLRKVAANRGGELEVVTVWHRGSLLRPVEIKYAPSTGDLNTCSCRAVRDAGSQRRQGARGVAGQKWGRYAFSHDRADPVVIGAVPFLNTEAEANWAI